MMHPIQREITERSERIRRHGVMLFRPMSFLSVSLMYSSFITELSTAGTLSLVSRSPQINFVLVLAS
jgi:hypothetical protein